LGKNIFEFLSVYGNHTPLDHVIRLYLVYIFLLIIGQGSRPCPFPIGWKKSQKFYAMPPFFITEES
jgi:hypothetical protein